MRVVTLMEVSGIEAGELAHWENLCRVWFERVWAAGATEVVVCYHTQACAAVPRGDARVTLRRVAVEPIVEVPRDMSRYGFSGDFGESGRLMLNCKLPAMMRMSREAPYIWLDWDALALVRLDPLWELTRERRWIGVGHQDYDFVRRFGALGIKPETYLNSGVLVVGGPAGFSMEDVRQVHLAGLSLQDVAVFYDDFVLTLLFAAQEYNWRHEVMDAGWNCWSRFAQVRCDYGVWKGGATDEAGNFCMVKVLHYYGESSKPWRSGCRMWSGFAKAPP